MTKKMSFFVQNRKSDKIAIFVVDFLPVIRYSIDSK